MDAHSASTLLLIAAAVVWILARQVRLAPVKPRLLVLTPLLLAYAGLGAVPSALWQDTTTVALLALGLVVSTGLGLWRGRTITVWRDEHGVWWRRGSKATLALWGVLLLARGVLYGVDAAAGHPAASCLGAVLLSLAVSFAGQNAVVALRLTPARRTAPVPAA